MFDRIDPELLPFLDSESRQLLQQGVLSVEDHQALLDEAKQKREASLAPPPEKDNKSTPEEPAQDKRGDASELFKKAKEATASKPYLDRARDSLRKLGEQIQGDSKGLDQKLAELASNLKYPPPEIPTWSEFHKDPQTSRASILHHSSDDEYSPPAGLPQAFNGFDLLNAIRNSEAVKFWTPRDDQQEAQKPTSVEEKSLELEEEGRKPRQDTTRSEKLLLVFTGLGDVLIAVIGGNQAKLWVSLVMLLVACAIQVGVIVKVRPFTSARWNTVLIFAVVAVLGFLWWGSRPDPQTPTLTKEQLQQELQKFKSAQPSPTIVPPSLTPSPTPTPVASASPKRRLSRRTSGPPCTAERALRGLC